MQHAHKNHKIEKKKKSIPHINHTLMATQE